MKTILFKNLNTALLHKEKRCLDARTYPIDWKIGLVKSTNKKEKNPHICRNIYKLMNCRINITYFVKYHEIF